MWAKIAEDLSEAFLHPFSAAQVENPYKTIMKRKNAAVNKNKRSGASRIDVPYEEEINKIAAVDDSIEPDVMRSVSEVIEKPSPSERATTSNPRKRKHQDVGDKIAAALLKVNEDRQKRHDEKMNLLRELFSKKCPDCQENTH